MEISTPETEAAHEREVVDRFEAFHKLNPQVYTHFGYYTKQLPYGEIYSAALVIGRMVWDYGIGKAIAPIDPNDPDGEEGHKISAVYIPLYARLYQLDHKEPGPFRLKTCRFAPEFYRRKGVQLPHDPSIFNQPPYGRDAFDWRDYSIWLSEYAHSSWLYLTEQDKPYRA